MKDLVGRTIVGVSETRWGDEIELRLDGGSLAVVRGFSYEDVDLEIRLLDLPAQNERARGRVGREHRDWLKRLVAGRRRVDEERIRAKARTELSPEAYKEWLRDRQMTLDRAGYLMRSLFADQITKALSEQSILFAKQTYGEHRVLPPETREMP